MGLKDFDDMSVDAQIASLAGMVERLIQDIREVKTLGQRSDESRGKMHAKIDELNRGQALIQLGFEHVRQVIETRLVGIEARLGLLETDSAAVKTMRARVEGAGKLGRILWTIGLALLGIVGWATGLLRSIFTSIPPHH